MPLYEYECRLNGHRFEVRQAVTEDAVRECPECGGEVRRVIHPVGIVFKGAGFYATDSRKGATEKTSPEKSKETPKETAKSESTSSTDSGATRSDSTKKT